MSIGSDKVRTNVTFPIALKEKLEEIAKKENRSLNNLIITILQKYVDSVGK